MSGLVQRPSTSIRTSSRASRRVRPSGSTSVPPETGSTSPSSRRIWKCISSRPSSSCSENQSQPTAPAPSALVLHSWSNQASPVTRPRARRRAARDVRGADAAARRHARVADVVRRVARLVALRREAAVAVGDEGLRRPQLEVEREAGGRVARDEPHGAAVGVQGVRPPVLEPDGERLARSARQAARAAREALGRGVAPGRHVRDREVREVDLVRGEARAFGRRAGREPAAEERELEAEAAAVGARRRCRCSTTTRSGTRSAGRGRRAARRGGPRWRGRSPARSGPGPSSRRAARAGVATRGAEGRQNECGRERGAPQRAARASVAREAAPLSGGFLVARRDRSSSE